MIAIFDVFLVFFIEGSKRIVVACNAFKQSSTIKKIFSSNEKPLQY